MTRDRSKLSAWEDMHASAYYAASESSFFLAAAQATYQKRNDEPRSWVRLGVFFVHTSCVDASPSVTISHAAVT